MIGGQKFYACPATRTWQRRFEHALTATCNRHLYSGPHDQGIFLYFPRLSKHGPLAPGLRGHLSMYIAGRRRSLDKQMTSKRCVNCSCTKCGALQQPCCPLGGGCLEGSCSPSSICIQSSPSQTPSPPPASQTPPSYQPSAPGVLPPQPPQTDSNKRLLIIVGISSIAFLALLFVIFALV